MVPEPDEPDDDEADERDAAERERRRAEDVLGEDDAQTRPFGFGGGSEDEYGDEPNDDDAEVLDQLTSQLKRLGGTSQITLRVKRIKPKKLPSGEQIAGFLIGFEFDEPPFKPVEILERLGRELGTGTYKLVAVNSDGRYVRGGTSAPIEIQAGPPKRWVPHDERRSDEGGQLLDERSIAYKVLLRQIEGGGDKDMSGIAELLREQVRSAETKANKAEAEVDRLRRSEREFESKANRLESDAARQKDKTEAAEKREAELIRRVEKLETELREVQRDRDRTERDLAKAEAKGASDGPLESLKVMREMGLVGQPENPGIELYKSAMSGFAEELPRMMSSIAEARGGDGSFTPKDIVEIADKALDTFGKRAEARAQADAQAAQVAQQQQVRAMYVEAERRRRAAALTHTPPAAGGPPARRAPRAPRRPPAAASGVSGASALSSKADPLASPGDAERAREAAEARPTWLGGNGAPTAAPRNEPAPAAEPPPVAHPEDDSGGMIDPGFLAEIEGHVMAGISGTTLAAVVDDWQTKGDDRAGVIHEILLQACIDAPYEAVLGLARARARGRLKVILDSEAGQKWFREWCAFWNPEGNPGVLDDAPTPAAPPPEGGAE